MPHLARQIIEGLYCYIWQGRGNNCNTYLLADVLGGERPHVIVDPGFMANELREPCFDSLLKSMQGDGLEVEDIGLIINTHTHPDHCHATEAIVARSARNEAGGTGSRALTALSREEGDYYEAVGQRMFGMFGMEMAKLDPSIHLAEGDLTFDRAGKSVDLQILLTPGHSPGSVSIYWPERKVLITGDVVFFASVGRTDFPGGSAAVLKQSIEKLATLDVEYLLPGHSTEFGSIVEGSEMVKRNFSAVRMLF
jgi:hydroxyacylglutathione hydrolase